jgi:hypothetical protein
MTTVFVSGALANKPRNGGAAWTRLSYVLGLRRLGFETYFVEQIRPQDCADESGAVSSFVDSVNRRYFREVIQAFGLAGSAVLCYEDGREVEGMTFSRLMEVASDADLLVNISGHLTLEPVLRQIRRKLYVDLDPGFTQLWHVQGDPGPRLEGHDAYFTVGTNLGRSDCPIPTGDVRWMPTLPPAVLTDWPAGESSEPAPFTTVASWRGPFGPVAHGGRTYGLKVHEFRRFVDLPELVDRKFELALDIHSADGGDRDLLLRHGWVVVDPQQVVPGPAEFRRYVQGSAGEFSAAQGIYVETGSGWFSDRSVRYLASGKPVLVQDTGFGRSLPVGEGLLTFRTLEEAVAGVREIGRDYERHAKAARAVAEEYFDSDRVLGRMLEDAGVSP